MSYVDAIDQLEQAIRQRYHVESLRGVGTLGDAIAAARNGDLKPIEAALEGREMYRWREAVDAALASARASPAADSGDESAARPLSRMNKAELIARAEEREIEVDEDATVAELRDLLREGED